LTALSSLKLADEQTVVGMAAVLQACQRVGWAPTEFGAWGVLAAPRFMGRPRLAHAITRFQKQGVRGMSPLIIPTLSQHAVASTICLILGCHGPNFGIGGNSTCVGETILNALSVLQAHPCPGVWAVMTAWEPEPIPDGTGQILAPTTGIGVALALTPQAAAGQVRLVMPHSPPHPQPLSPENRGEGSKSGNGSLLELADFLEQPENAASWRFAFPGGGGLEIVPGGLATPLRQAG
jgi:hypothetical protein